MSKRIITRTLSFVTVFLMMAAAAVSVNGRLFGHAFPTESDSASSQPDSSITVNADGTVTVNTASLCQKISGYGGPVPVEIVIKNDTVQSVTPLPNSETPGFFNRVISSGLIDRWNGKTAAEAAAMKVDGATGATYSSTALIRNVQAGVAKYEASKGEIVAVAKTRASLGAKFWCALAVVLLGMIVPLFTKNRRYRTVQQLLNVGVLGFWTGTFVDYTLMLGLMGNGVSSMASAVALLMLVAAFVYPLFGKMNHYCNWICPLGSLQELALKCNPRHRLKLSSKTVKILSAFRIVLWGTLMMLLWLGFLTSWIDYELFTAFMIGQATTAVLVASALIVLLSIWIPRPYCRFICPTGTLMRVAEDLDTK